MSIVSPLLSDFGDLDDPETRRKFQKWWQGTVRIFRTRTEKVMPERNLDDAMNNVEDELTRWNQSQGGGQPQPNHHRLLETPDYPPTLDLNQAGQQTYRWRSNTEPADRFYREPTSSEFHPFVIGLLRELPQAGESWPDERRKLWFDTAASIFKMIYKD